MQKSTATHSKEMRGERLVNHANLREFKISGSQFFIIRAYSRNSRLKNLLRILVVRAVSSW